ncbi:MAG: hypothetical protein ACRDD7_17440 [Peptostreptococcaceae bacterium]
MPTISGVLAYDLANVYSFPNPPPAGRIAGVPIVLQDTVTNNSLTVLTDAAGAFSFLNVPAGTYNLVEAWGATGGVASPGDFNTASVAAPPTPLDPPITQVSNPPATATRLQSLTRNTIPLTVTTSNLTGQNFVDGPIIEQPLLLSGTTIIGSNLITDAQTGQWGTLPNGSANQLIPATEPYPGVSPSETYVANPATIAASSAVYNVTNIAYSASYTTLWYSIANHTTFDETSRFMVINLAGTGPASNERFFQTTVNVKPNTYYIGIAWVLYQQNLVIGVPPQVGVRVSDTGGNVIFQSPTPQLTFSNPPKWVEIGGVFFTGNNSTVVVAYQSIASGTLSNDLMADDFAIFEVNINDIITVEKTVDKTIANVGDTLTYTIVLTNTGSTTALNVLFSDTIPDGTTFNVGSVNVDSVNQPTFNPNTGFNIGSLSPGSTSTITFNVNATSVPSSGIALNESVVTYSFQPTTGGVTIPNTVLSNQTETDIVNAQISKTVSSHFSDVNTTLTYSITYFNESSLPATNVVFIDTIPNGSTFVNNSLTVDNIPVAGNPNPPGINLANVAPNTTITIKFDVLTNSTVTPSTIVNSATIGAVFTNTLNDSLGVTLNSNIVTTTILSAIINSSKTVSDDFADIGDILTYTITMTNTGNTTATNLLFQDAIPNGTTLIPGSFKQDSTVISSPPNIIGVTLPNNLSPNSTTTITFMVQVTSIPSPNPIINTAMTSYDYIIDSTTTPNIIGENDTTTNSVQTLVNNASLSGITKSVNRITSSCGDLLVYTITLPNSGSITATNVIIIDTVPNGTVLVPNSVFVNGILQSNANPTLGISVPDISPQSSASITFTVIVQC